MNAPHASHVDGVWECEIRTVRSVLNSILSLPPAKMDDSSWQTFLYEAMAIVNSRPLTGDCLTDSKCLKPITPNHLFTLKSTAALPPPRKRWRQVQYLSEQFWSRCRTAKIHLGNLKLDMKGKHIDKPSVIERPIQKLALLMENIFDDKGV